MLKIYLLSAFLWAVLTTYKERKDLWGACDAGYLVFFFIIQFGLAPLCAAYAALVRVIDFFDSAKK